MYCLKLNYSDIFSKLNHYLIKLKTVISYSYSNSCIQLYQIYYKNLKIQREFIKESRENYFIILKDILHKTGRYTLKNQQLFVYRYHHCCIFYQGVSPCKLRASTLVASTSSPPPTPPSTSLHLKLCIKKGFLIVKVSKSGKLDQE